MTTPETQREPLDTTPDETGRDDRPADLDAPMETQAAPAEPMPRDVQPETTETDVAPTDPDATSRLEDTVASSGPAQSTESSEQILFADGELSDLHSRWTEVQAAFVDDPRDCVHKADTLVADVVDKLTAGFSAARSRLEEQWDRGEEVSTEDLRVALKRYRDFFERLLAV
jgi:hypothetical protein